MTDKDKKEKKDISADHEVEQILNGYLVKVKIGWDTHTIFFRNFTRVQKFTSLWVDDKIRNSLEPSEIMNKALVAEKEAEFSATAEKSVTVHRTEHPLAGKMVRIKLGTPDGLSGAYFRVRDWYDRVYGQNWLDTPFDELSDIAKDLKARIITAQIPLDDEVVVGVVVTHSGGNTEAMVHVTEMTLTGDAKEKAA